MTVSQSNTAAALPVGFQQTFRMQRTAAQTGVVQMCFAQEVESVNAFQFQGQTAELEFNAFTGANFSPAAPFNMTAYIIYGTSTDEGASKMAFGLNAGGGGASAWTGQANATAAVIGLGGVSTLGRYAAVASIPATATELGVALCYTPVGTAGTTDAIYFSGIQLTRNPTNAKYASATVGYSCDNTNNVQINCATFERRPASLEGLLQYRYRYWLTEVTGPSVVTTCRARSVTVADCNFNFPVPMRVAPTMTYTTGFGVETTTAGGTINNCSALATSANVASTAVSTQAVMVACTATTVPAAGTADFLWNNNAGGIIKATAEMT
jgi:hypothetical protein